MVWRCMHAQTVILRPYDPNTLEIWQILVNAFLDRPELLEELICHAGRGAQRFGGDYRSMYSLIMKCTLEHRAELSASFYALMRDQKLVPDKRASQCIASTVNSNNPHSAFETFQHIYVDGKERDLYDSCFQALKVSSASNRTMYKWNHFLLSHGDLPSLALRSHPLVSVMLSRSKHISGVEKSMIETEDPAEQLAAVQEFFPLTRERLNTVVGEVHGIKQKSVTDAFCARVFATGGLSTGLLVAGLAMLGLDTVGPLAMRELAARSQTTSVFLETLQSIRARKISITPSVFSKALEKFAQEDKQELFDSVVHSDRHPDTYEDRELLERLVDEYLRSEKVPEAHVILAVLSMTVKETGYYRWNALIQAEARIHRPDKVMSLVQDMISQKLVITDDTITSVRDNLLRPRQSGKRPQITGKRKADEGDDLVVVTNLLLSVANAGKRIHISHWRELIKRYGLEGRMTGLRHLVLELVRLHTPRASFVVGALMMSSKPSLTSTHRPLRITSPLRQLFNPPLQRAIVGWGFQSEQSEKWLPAALRGQEPSPGSPEEEKWLRGLALLIRLHEAGVPIDIPVVRKEIIAQLGRAFVPRIVLLDGARRVVSNNDAELLRRYDLVEQAWGSKGLFRFGNQRHFEGADRAAWVLHCLFERTGFTNKRGSKTSVASRGQFGHRTRTTGL
ncbi:hypothetical protein ANO11243_006960 [Dothideomycetidae sp. 11243]|nr:hypothetical protein ANO11243_006960 [fungal sp. No.11243]